jgi:hypothetical protein
MLFKRVGNAMIVTDRAGEAARKVMVFGRPPKSRRVDRFNVPVEGLLAGLPFALEDSTDD